MKQKGIDQRQNGDWEGCNLICDYIGGMVTSVTELIDMKPRVYYVLT